MPPGSSPHFDLDDREVGPVCAGPTSFLSLQACWQAAHCLLEARRRRGGATLAHWAIPVLRLPAFQAFPGRFWHLTDTLLGALWLLPLLVAPPAAALYGVLRWRSRRGPKLLLLVLVGLALLEGRGIDALRERMVSSGHAEFVAVAAGREDVLYVLSPYEQLVQAGELGQYAHSKPPGQLLLYMTTERVAHWI